MTSIDPENRRPRAYVRSPFDPGRKITAQRFRSIRPNTLGAAMSSTINQEVAVAQGSPKACLVLGKQLSQSAGQNSNLGQRDNFNRAALLYTVGIMFETTGSSRKFYSTTNHSSGSVDDPSVVDSGFCSSVEDCPKAPVYHIEETRLLTDLVKPLISLHQQSLILSSDPPFPLPNFSSASHQTIIDDIIHSMGFSHETLPSPATLSYLYAKKLYHQVSQRPKPRSRATRRGTSKGDENLESLLNDLISAYAVPPTASQKISALNEPSHDTLPSPSSQEDATKDSIPFPSSRRILGRLNTGTGESSSGITRTPTSSIFSSSECPPSPSIIARLRFDSSKSSSTTSISSVSHSTMGSFTPVSAKTAVISLKPFIPQDNPRRRAITLYSRVGFGARNRPFFPTQWDEEASDKTEYESSDSDWTKLPSSDAYQHHSRRRSIASQQTIPSLSLTHSSFVPPSAMTSYIPSPLQNQNAQNSPISSHPPPFSSPHSKPHNRRSSTMPSEVATRPPAALLKASDACRTERKGLDPTLAALEKACRLKAKVICAMCGDVGYDFPRVKTGEALCTRECRILWKDRQTKGVPAAGKESLQKRSATTIPVL